MNIIPVANVGQYGIITDLPTQELPLNAWTAGKNVKMRDGYVEKFSGHANVFGVPGVPPYWNLAVPTPAAYRWLYAGLNKVYAWDGNTHVNITRQTAGVDVNYSANATINWTGGLLSGVPVLSNGVDVPQFWNIPGGLTRLADLPNWPVNTFCNSIRPFKQFLVACDITKANVHYKHMVKWSHPADPGFIPVSWDEADETRDAGEFSLSESPGAVLDSMPLRDINIIYKEDEVWGQQYIAGTDIFRFFNIFRSIGGISRRCAEEIFAGTHVLFGYNDVVTHNGQQATSILDAKTKRRLYSSMDSANYQKSFVANNTSDREAWFCFCEKGHTVPNIAFVWNYFSQATSFRDLPDVSAMAPGVVDSQSLSDTWDANDGSWADWLVTWGERDFNPALKTLLMCCPVENRLCQANTGNRFGEVDMTSYIEKSGIGFPLKANNPPDFSTEKFMTRLWPRLSGTAGATVNIHVGTQEKIDGPITWRAIHPYIIGETDFIEPMITSRLHALRFESLSDITWKLYGYDCEVRSTGRHYGG